MKKQKYKTMYMHTMDGKPAQFLYSGLNKGLFFVCRNQHVTLCKSLREIRKQQQISLRDNERNTEFRLGYNLVKVPS